MGLAATLKGAASAGLAGAVTGGIGSIVSGGLGLLGGLFKRNNNGFKNQQKHRWNKEKTIITYKAHNGQDLPLPRYYKTTIYTDDQRQLLWLYAEDEGVKWVKGFKVIGANTVNKDYNIS